MSELKSFIVLYDGKFIRAYKASEADKVIAELKAHKAQAEDDVAFWKGKAAKLKADYSAEVEEVCVEKTNVDTLEQVLKEKDKEIAELKDKLRHYPMMVTLLENDKKEIEKTEKETYGGEVMAIELHHLHPGHDDELTRLKARIAELERMDIEHTVQIAKMNGYIHHMEEELKESKRKEKESRELADPYTLYCETSAEALRKALGEYRWRRPCDDRPPEWNCVIVYFHNEEGEEQYRLAVYSKENGWEVDDEEVYKTAEIEAWHPLPMPPEEEK